MRKMLGLHNTAKDDQPLPPSPLLPMILVGNCMIGGVEQNVVSTVTYLRRMGASVVVAVPYFGELAGSLLDNGLPAEDLLTLEMGDHLSINALAQLVAIVHNRGIDLLHSHLRPADNLAGAAGWHTGIPALSTIHGTVPSPHDVALHTLYGLKYLAVSESTREMAVARGIAHDAIRVIRNGVDTGRFKPDSICREAVRLRLGLRAEDVLVLCVARLSWEKCPESLVDAALLSLEQAPHLRFAFVGAGPLEFKLRRMIAASGRERELSLLGLRRDVPELLAASDVVALTSLSEGLPYAVLEAMAMERPVVVHDVGGVGEAVEDGSEAFLVAPGNTAAFADRLVTLARDQGLRSRMGRAAREKVLRCFDADDSNAAVLEAYVAELAAARVAMRRSG